MSYSSLPVKVGYSKIKLALATFFDIIFFTLSHISQLSPLSQWIHIILGISDLYVQNIKVCCYGHHRPNVLSSNSSLIADSNREKKMNAIAPKKTLFKIIQQDTNLFSESLLIHMSEKMSMSTVIAVHCKKWNGQFT